MIRISMSLFNQSRMTFTPQGGHGERIRMNKTLLVLTLALTVTVTACGNTAEQPNAAPPAADGSTSASPASPATADNPASQPAGAAAAAPATPIDRGPVAARVNGVPIYKIDYETALQNFMQSNNLGPDTPEDKRKEIDKIVLDGLIGTELLYQKAKATPIEVPQADIDRAVTQTKENMGEEGLVTELAKRKMVPGDLANLIRQNMMIQKMIQETVVGPLQVTDAEMKQFYDEHISEMAEPESVEASHIMVKTAAADPAEKKAEARKKIDGALARTKSGEDFGAVAKSVSEDGSAANGGQLGAVRRGQTPPPFESAAFGLEVGQVSGVVESQFGLHIIKVTAKHPAGTAPFEKAKPRIGEFLKQQKSQKAIEQLVDSLRSSAKVEIL